MRKVLKKNINIVGLLVLMACFLSESINAQSYVKVSLGHDISIVEYDNGIWFKALDTTWSSNWVVGLGIDQVLWNKTKISLAGFYSMHKDEEKQKENNTTSRRIHQYHNHIFLSSELSAHYEILKGLFLGGGVRFSTITKTKINSFYHPDKTTIYKQKGVNYLGYLGSLEYNIKSFGLQAKYLHVKRIHDTAFLLREMNTVELLLSYRFKVFDRPKRKKGKAADCPKF